MISLLDEDLHVAAARVALLALRATLGRQGPPPPNRFRLPNIARTLGPETAALELARLPRPVPLEGVVEGGVIVVARDRDEVWMEPAPPELISPRLARLRPDEYPRLPVCCIGAGEALLVTMRAAEAALRDYPVLEGDYEVGSPAFYLGEHPRIARQAQQAGAVRVVRFHFPVGTPTPEDLGDVIVLVRSGSHDRPRVLEHEPGASPCALCGAPDAGWRETATWKKPWRVRRLCSACVAARMAPLALAKAAVIDEWLNALSPSQVREMEREIAHDLDCLEAPFRHLAMPRELRSIIDRWRARLSG